MCSRGVTLLAEGDPRAALQEFNEALTNAVGDTRADSLYNIAVCYVRLGDVVKATQAIAEAVAIDPALAEEIRLDEDFAPLAATKSFQNILKAASPEVGIRIRRREIVTETTAEVPGPSAEKEIANDKSDGRVGTTVRDSALPSPRQRNGLDAAAQAVRRYKVVPFSAAVSSTQDPAHLASQVEDIICTHASSGWEYVGVHQLQTFRAGSSGCFGLGATPPTSITTEFVVFRQ